MPVIRWNESLSVGIDEFDNQHKKLVSMINELYDATRQKKGRTIIDTIIDELFEYAKTHFRAEENYFSQIGFPEADSHIMEHKDFVKKVSTFRKELQNGKIGVTADVMIFLSEWLLSHIKESDKQYGLFSGKLKK